MMRWARPLLVLLVGAAALSLWSCSAEQGPAADNSVLHRGVSSDPESLDPHKARSVQAADILRDIGEGLLAYSASGELIPGVAESWQIAEDGKTYTFTLRDDARWSNGSSSSACGDWSIRRRPRSTGRCSARSSTPGQSSRAARGRPTSVSRLRTSGR